MSRPNIVEIMSDDQGAWALGCAGNSEVRTPSLDRLAVQGMRFESFFCASPVCSPARASFLTGRIPSQHGVHDWIRAGNIDSPDGAYTWGKKPDHPIRYLEGLRGYTALLAEQGYVCGLSGKWHLGDSGTPQQGYTWWLAHTWAGSSYYGAPFVRDGKPWIEPRYVTDVITEGALEFLASRKGRREPFHLSVHYTAPHSPWDRANHPAALYDEYRTGCPFRSTPEEPPNPRQMNSAPIGTGEARKDHLAGYYAAITAMDNGIGRILEAIDGMGIRGDTLIIFSSDNGMNMGHHGLWGKGNASFPLNMYDTSVKVPFLVSMPGTITQGSVCRELASQYDVMPTILDLLGIRNPEAAKLPGRSFAPLLLGKGAEGEGRERIFVLDEYGPVRMIRTREWKYVHRFPYGPHELYHLERDPGERDNLYGSADYRGQWQSMKAELDAWFARFVDPSRDGVREGVTGKGQLERCGPAGKGAQAFADDVRLLATGEKPV